MKIYIARHWSTTRNEQKRIQWQNNIELSEKWIEESKKLSKELENIKIDYVYYSCNLQWKPFLRTEFLAKQVAKNKNIQYFANINLRERSFWDLEWVTYKEIEEKYKKDLDTLLKDPEIYKNLNIETDESLMNRAKSFFNWFETKHKDQNILIVWHNAINSALISYLENKEYELIRMPNAWLYCYDIVEK